MIEQILQNVKNMVKVIFFNSLNISVDLKLLQNNKPKKKSRITLNLFPDTFFAKKK